MKTLWKVSVTGYELLDKEPNWPGAEWKKVQYEPEHGYVEKEDGDTYKVKTHLDFFFNTEEEANEKAANYVGEDKDEYRKVFGVYKCQFEDEFIERAKWYTEQLNNSGEFAFEWRKKIRKQMREELVPTMKADKSNKSEVYDKRAYLRYFC